MALSDKDAIRMEATLRKSGVRVTGQRIAILATVAGSADHPDAEEVYQRAKATAPSMSLATVYRTLLVFEQAGIIQRHAFEGGGARFESAQSEHHDHIVDLDTGHVTEFNSDEIERLQTEIAARLGYEVIHHRLELYCRKIRR